MEYLEKILRSKRKEISTLLKRNLVLQEKASTGQFKAALKQDGLSVIAEVKRTSPSRGKIGAIANPGDLAELYCKGGASALSVLTDMHFEGSLQDLEAVVNAVNLPILRKDFILHPAQLIESALFGASAVLLIACVLKKELPFFINAAARCGLEPLVEIHDESELDLALKARAKIIGVNHRNLRTFEMDMTLSEKLASYIPEDIVKVAESGIHFPEQARALKRLGYDAILVGEALVKSASPSKLIAELKQCE